MERQKAIHYTIALSAVCTSFICCHNKYQAPYRYEGYKTMISRPIATPDDIAQRFPKSVEQIKQYTKWAYEAANKGINALIAIPTEKRTFNNTVRAFDTVQGNLKECFGTLSVLRMLSPNDELRATAKTESLILQGAMIDLNMNPDLYQAFENYLTHNKNSEALSSEEERFLTETMQDFKRNGIHLPKDKLERCKKLNKDIASLTAKFEAAISSDTSSIQVDRQGLLGLSESFITALQRTKQGAYLLTCDYPTYFEVMEHCSVETTRKALYYAFQNRAYPANLSTLNNIISVRHQLAQELGFPSFAHLNIDSEMATNPETVELFLSDLIAKGKIKAETEWEHLKQYLPKEITLTKEGRINPWDIAFAKENYKKSHFQLDQREVAEYFPVDKTLQGMLDIYQDFLGLTFKPASPSWSWYDDVQMIAIHDKDTDKLRGYLFLDLYPRENKYSHACHLCFIAGQRSPSHTRPSVAVVVANFPKPTPSRPALLKHADVTTFFHEFGHAMHSALGHTELLCNSGTAVKRDFVEMPSQMFEEWMFDKAMLKKVSSHYKTGEPLPDAMINTLIELKKFDSGSLVVRQCFLSLFALKIYQQETIDTDALLKTLHEQHIEHAAYAPGTHFQASFGHLTGYGARYYSYMWSKVFALDIFDHIKKVGLLKPETGRSFASAILSKGGGDDPQNLLQNFLGRKPSPQAFYKDLGI